MCLLNWVLNACCVRMDWPFRGCFGAIDAAADECINKRAEPDRVLPSLRSGVLLFSGRINEGQPAKNSAHKQLICCWLASVF